MSAFDPLDYVPWECPESMRLRAAADRMALAESEGSVPLRRWSVPLITLMAQFGAHSPRHLYAMVEVLEAAAEFHRSIPSWNGGSMPVAVKEYLLLRRLTHRLEDR
jgi:hypothetical protein